MIGHALFETESLWLLSYNDCDTIRNLYSVPGIYIEKIERINNLAQRYDPGSVYREVFISNYDTSQVPSEQTMPIISSNALITLHTRNSSYQMKVDELGTLLHTYYGSRIDETDMSYQICYMDRGFSGNPYEVGKTDRSYSLDVLPQEYSCFGTGDFRTTALRVQNPDGSQAAQLRVLDFEILPGKYSLNGLPAVYAQTDEAETLAVRLRDESSGIEVELLYGVLPELDIITRAARITNRGEGAVVLQKAASMNIDWQYGEGFTYGPTNSVPCIYHRIEDDFKFEETGKIAGRVGVSMAQVDVVNILKMCL